jgi:hypothetical protein
MIVTRIYAAADGGARIERRTVPMAPDTSGRATSGDFAALRLFFRDTPPAHVPVPEAFDITHWPLAD